MLTVLAGDTVEVNFEDGTFVAGEKGENTFTIRTLNYFEAQKVLAAQTDEAKVSTCMELGLVAIGGSEERAKAFLKSPKARLVNPLFAAIWELAWGN